MKFFSYKPFWILLAVVVFSTVLVSGALWALQGDDQPRSPTVDLQENQKLFVAYSKELLSVDLKNVDLKDMMDKLAQETGAKISVSPLVAKKLTLSFQNLPLEEGLSLLLKDTDYSVVYGQARGVESKKTVIKSIVVVSKGERDQEIQQLQLPPNAIVRTATWPQQSPDRALASSLPEASQLDIKRSPLPVLLPPNPSLTGRAVMIIRPTGYSATIDEYYPNIQVSVRGEAILYTDDFERRSPTERVRSLPATLTRGEIGWFLSWDEFGVSYEVFLGCAYQDSPYCAPDYVQQVANSLVYAGGSGVPK